MPLKRIQCHATASGSTNAAAFSDTLSGRAIQLTEFTTISLARPPPEALRPYVAHFSHRFRLSFWHAKQADAP